MATSDKELQKWLRQLVLQDNGKAAAKANPNSARILPSAGAVWWQFGKQSGSNSDNQDPNGNNDGRNGNGGEGEHDPTKTPEEGGSANGVGPLFECGKKGGKCINIRLNGVAKQPESFDAPCQPPEADGNYYYSLWLTKVHAKTDLRVFLEDSNGNISYLGSTYADYQQYVSAKFKDIIKILDKEAPEWLTLGAAKDGTTLEKIRNFQPSTKQPYLQYYQSQYAPTNADLPTLLGTQETTLKGWKSGTWMGCSVYLVKCRCGDESPTSESPTGQSYPKIDEIYKICEKNKQSEHQQSRGTEWDKQACSEVIATANGFQAACPNLTDPNMPAIFKHRPTAFTLCDKNGNPVTIEQKGAGFAISTNTYTAEVDSQLKFKNVKQKTPA